MLFGTFFFLSSDKVVMNRTAWNILDLISKVGGIFALLRTSISLLGVSINANKLISRMTKQLYFVVDKGSQGPKFKHLNVSSQDSLFMPLYKFMI